MLKITQQIEIAIRTWHEYNSTIDKRVPMFHSFFTTAFPILGATLWGVSVNRTKWGVPWWNCTHVSKATKDLNMLLVLVVDEIMLTHTVSASTVPLFWAKKIKNHTTLSLSLSPLHCSLCCVPKTTHRVPSHLSGYFQDTIFFP